MNNTIHLQHRGQIKMVCKKQAKESFKAEFNILNSVKGHYTFN